MDKSLSRIFSKFKIVGNDRELLALGSGVFLVIIVSTGLNFLEKSIGVNLMTSLGALLALSKYFYEKRKDKKREIIELVSFFRDTVIGFHEKFGKELRQHFEKQKRQLVFRKVPFSKQTIEYVRMKHSAFAEVQYKYIFNENKEIEILATHTLNSLEEFALKVNLLDAADSEYLVILQDTFIEIVEDLTVLLLYHRGGLHDESMYSNTVGLYRRWEPNYSRRPAVERVQEFKKKLGIKN